MKVLIYHKMFPPFLAGGAFQPLMFIAELQKTCDVTLAVNDDANLEKAAEMSGVAIDPGKLKVVKLDSGKGFASRHEWYAALVRTRKLKKLAKDADVCISTANVIDFGKGAHHFIYLLSQFAGAAFYDYLMGRGGGMGPRRLFRRFSTAMYENIVKPLFGVRSVRRIFADPNERIYPTSKYVEKILEGYFGPFNSEVFYPPTTFEFRDASVPRDPLLAIYVGRIFAPKRITDIVETVEKARALAGKDLKLHIAGQLVESPYIDNLKRLEKERPWLKLVGPVYGRDKERFMLSATYALHAERDEAFGIAIAEYLKAGCIPLVPDAGGPREIVARKELEFRTVDQAARTLADLVLDADFRDAMRTHCAEHGREFTVDAYVARERRLMSGITASAKGTES